MDKIVIINPGTHLLHLKFCTGRILYCWENCSNYVLFKSHLSPSHWECGSFWRSLLNINSSLCFYTGSCMWLCISNEGVTYDMSGGMCCVHRPGLPHTPHTLLIPITIIKRRHWTLPWPDTQPQTDSRWFITAFVSSLSSQTVINPTLYTCEK